MALVTINGKELQVDDGALILHVAKDAGFEIPTFCYHAKLSKLGSCRMCLVEIEGMRKLQPSCITPVMDGMKVHTESDTLIEARKAQMEFLLINHPLDCPVCDQAGECDLQDLSFKFGGTSGRFRWKKRTFEKRDMGPSLVKEMNRCIACRRCSRYCAEISGDFAISELNRGHELEMGSFYHTPIESEFVGNTAQLCPVGALTSKPSRFKARSWDLIGTETICPLCSVGCSITSESKYVSQEATQMLQTKCLGAAAALDNTELLVLRNSATEDKGATEISLCDRGRYGYHFINSEERLSAPLVKKDGKLVKTSWEEAITLVSAKLSTIIEREGADAVGGITSGICTNEDAFLFRKLFNDVIGTNNVAVSTDGTLTDQSTLRLASMRGSLKGIKESDAILILGSSVSTETPIASMNAGIAARMNGATLTVMTAGEQRFPYSNPTVINYARGTELATVGALIKTIIDNKLVCESFSKDRKKELEALIKSVKDGKTGISKEDLLATAKSLAAASKGTILFGDDLIDGATASDVVEALYGLAALLGYNGEKGQIIYTPGAGNQAGSLDMGLSGALVDAASVGKFKGLYVMGDNPVATAFDQEGVKDALEKLDFLVVQDIFLTETAEMADVVLPALSYAERNGTMTNMEGRLQRLNRSIKPAGDGREDWQIVQEIASAMGGKLDYINVDAVRLDIAASIPSYEGLTPDQIGRDGAFVDAAKMSQPTISGFTLKSNGKADGGKTYPLQIIAGRDVFFGGSLTSWDEGVRSLSVGPRILISDETGASLDISDGDEVTVESKKGSLNGVVKVTAGVGEGVVVLPMNHPEMDPRAVLNDAETSTGGKLTKSS